MPQQVQLVYLPNESKRTGSRSSQWFEDHKNVFFSFLPGVVVPVAESCAGAQGQVRKSGGFVHQPNSRKEILFVFDLYVFVFTRSRYCIIQCRFLKMTARYRDDICETQLPSSKKGLDVLKAGLLESKQESFKLPGLVYLAWLLMIPSPPNTYTCTWNHKKCGSGRWCSFSFRGDFQVPCCWGFVQWVWKNQSSHPATSMLSLSPRMVLMPSEQKDFEQLSAVNTSWLGGSYLEPTTTVFLHHWSFEKNLRFTKIQNQFVL